MHISCRSLRRSSSTAASGRFLENQKLKPEIRDTIYDTLQTITGQRPITVLARKSVSNFKVREVRRRR